jgi:hypothetical protein
MRKKKEQKTITILSLGAGIQSTALALMAERGMIEKPIAAIFADTGDEPPAVHEHLERLKGMLSFPVHTVSAGHLGGDFLESIQGQKTKASQPPFYVISRMSENDVKKVLAKKEPKTSKAWIKWNQERKLALKPDNGGMLWRQCTADYKIMPIRRESRRIMKEAGASHIIEQIGISTDERIREKKSRVKYVTHSHPLLDLGWSRQKCEAWLKENYGMKPGKSAYYYCPYRSNENWRAMKKNDPEQFEKACQFDENLRSLKNPRGCGIKGDLYVYRKMIPLRDAIFETGQGEFDFGMEQDCDGMCGN